MVTLAQSLELRTDAESFVETAKDKGYTVVLISGSVDTLVEVIAQRLATHSWLACTKSVFKNNTLIDLRSMGDEGPAKVALVTEAGIQFSEQTVAIGDGGNEKELFMATKGILIGNTKPYYRLPGNR